MNTPASAYKYIKPDFLKRIQALATPERTRARWVKEKVRSMFDGRKGHGGGRCCSRVLDADQLTTLLSEAYLAGYKSNGENAQVDLPPKKGGDSTRDITGG